MERFAGKLGAPIRGDRGRDAVESDIKMLKYKCHVHSGKFGRDRVKMYPSGKPTDDSQYGINLSSVKLHIRVSADKIHIEVGPTALGRGEGLKKAGRRQVVVLVLLASYARVDIVGYDFGHLREVIVGFNIL